MLPFWTIEIIESLTFDAWKRVLDIWLWDGDASRIFLERWLEVHATWLEIDSYNLEKKIKDNIKLKENFVTKLEYDNDFFDYVLASHIIEHEINPGLAFREIHRVLKNWWKLVICLPPYKSKIVGWHINVGYNLWQLMYQLLLSWFNIKHWSFINYGYNICAVVEKDTSLMLPKLRYDKGDIELLSEFFPFKAVQGFEWNIRSINWHSKLPNLFLKRIFNFLKSKMWK
jgi:SAM-dependent methyltransferase